MTRPLLAAVCLVLLAVSPALAADKPGKGNPHAGGNGGNPGAKAQGGRSDPSVNVQIHFTDVDRRTVADFYAPQINAGNCPPGLAKKRNGCQPPGQAKKWQIGRPLPRDVVFHAVPGALIARLPMPPDGQKYVRVASDILLITVGTGLVLGAIEDLGRIQ